jgi:hypothetical protein
MISSRPALELVADDLSHARPAAPGDRRIMCRFLDGSWSLVRVADWRKDGDGRWLCLICWNVAGRPYGAWFIYDKAFFWMLS